MNFIEHEVIKFKRENRIGKVTYKKLLLVCHRLGYVVKNYSESELFLMACDLRKKAQKATSLSVVDANNVIIFLKDDLSAERKLFALAHEIGHIYLKHKYTEEEQAEKEADQFAHLLIDKWEIKYKEYFVSIIAFLICIIIYLLLLKNV